MKTRIKKAVSAGLAGLMILSIAIPVFGAAAGEDPPAAEAEAAESSREETVLFLDTENGLDENDGQTAETALQSLDAVLERFSEQPETQECILVLCAETELTPEEERLVEEQEITVMTQAVYEEPAAEPEPENDGEKPSETPEVTVTPGETSLQETPGGVSPIPLLLNEENEEEENTQNAEGQTELLLQENLQEAAELMMQPEVLAAPMMAVQEEVTEPQVRSAAAAELPPVETAEDQPVILMASAPGKVETEETVPATEQIAEVPAVSTTEKISEVPAVSEPEQVAEAPVVSEPAQQPAAIAPLPAETVTEAQQPSEETTGNRGMMLLSLPGRDLVGTGTTQSSGSTSQPSASSQGSAAAGQSQSVTPVSGGKRLTDPVDTGDEHIWLPYILSAVLSGMAWILLNKQNLDQRRKEKSRIFAEEMEAFRRACME